jgi:hypothetical protein
MKRASLTRVESVSESKKHAIEITPEILPSYGAIERLAQSLREKMEHLDPTETGDLSWEELRERDREFYRSCIEDVLLRHRELVNTYFRQLSHDDSVDGSPEIRE